MTRTELRAVCLAIWGTDWPDHLARALKVDKRTITRWTSGDLPVPDEIEEQIPRVLGVSKSPLPLWPRDEWIVQREEGRRIYIVHTVAPRFIARAVECDENGEPVPEEGEVDILNGIVYSSGDIILCEIDWIDAPPKLAKILHIMDRACDVLEDAY